MSAMGLRKAILVVLACIAALGASLAARAESGPGTEGKAHASMDFRIVIPMVLRVSVVSQPVSIELDERHLMQGYIELDAATLVRLTSNDPRGLNVSVAFDTRLVSRVVVSLLDNVIAAEGSGASRLIRTTTRREQQVPVSYRLYLDSRATAGVHPWPVVLGFSSASA
jgi:hypothetical protein